MPPYWVSDLLFPLILYEGAESPMHRYYFIFQEVVDVIYWHQHYSVPNHLLGPYLRTYLGRK